MANSNRYATMEGLKLKDDYLLVAAIDFGTTYSGYAYSFNGSPTKITINKTWDSSAISSKTPTVVLTNPDDSFNSFGYRAEEGYLQHEPGEGYQMYRYFKTPLYLEHLSMDHMVESVSGHQRKAIDIIAMSLKFLKEHMTLRLNKEVEAKVTGKKLMQSNEIFWVLTVPAIASDVAKQLMRQAAFEAGMIQEVSSESLLIALESDVAPYFYRLISERSHTHLDVGLDYDNILIGDKILVVDAGGGAVDITAHEVLRNGQVRQLAPPTVHICGGMVVNKHFIEALAKVFGQDFIIHTRAKLPQQWYSFEDLFETAKKHLKSDGVKKLRIALPFSFNNEFHELKGKSIEAALSDCPDDDISFANGALFINPNKVRDIFEATCTQIVKHAKSRLQRETTLEGVQNIVLVGGYANSTFLQDACAKAFDKNYKVIVPYSAESFILQGAVMFGHQTTTYTRLEKMEEKQQERLNTQLQRISEEFIDKTVDTINHKLDGIFDALEPKQKETINGRMVEEKPVRVAMETQIEELTKYVQEMPAATMKESHHNEYVYYRIFNIIARHIGCSTDQWKELAEKLLASFPGQHLRATLKLVDERHTSNTDKAFEILMTWKVFTAEDTAITYLMKSIESLHLDIKGDIDKIITIQERKCNSEARGSLSDKGLDKVAEKIGHNWRSLGFHLGFENPILDQLESDHPRLHGRTTEMLIRWRNSSEDPPEEKWVKLQQAMKQCRMQGISTYDSAETRAHSQSSEGIITNGNQHNWTSSEEYQTEDESEENESNGSMD